MIIGKFHHSHLHLFYVPRNTKQAISETFSLANLVGGLVLKNYIYTIKANIHL